MKIQFYKINILKKVASSEIFIMMVWTIFFLPLDSMIYRYIKYKFVVRKYVKSQFIKLLEWLDIEPAITGIKFILIFMKIMFEIVHMHNTIHFTLTETIRMVNVTQKEKLIT